MGTLHLNPDAKRYPVDYLHTFGCRESGRFARLLCETWNRLPADVRRVVWEGWRRTRQAEGRGPVVVLAPRLPDDRGTPIYAYCFPRRGILLFNAEQLARFRDEQVVAVAAHELAHCYADLLPGAERSRRADCRSARAREEKATDALVDSWGLPMKSLRTWQGLRQGPPDVLLFPEAYGEWVRADFDDRPNELSDFAKRVRALIRGARLVA